MSFKKSLWVFFLFFPFSIQAATRYVATTGSDSGDCTVSGSPCDTVQYAVDQSADGDVIQIAAGTYSGLITVISKTLVFNGAGAGETVLTGTDTTRVFNIDAPGETVTIGSVTVTNGRTAGSFDYGACIMARGDIMIGALSLNITDSVIQNCVTAHADSVGGGIYFEGGIGGTLTIANAAIIDNTSSSGAGIYSSNSNVFTNVTFSGNTSMTGSGLGGGVRGFQNSTCNNCTFAGNTSSDGGGAFYFGSGTFTFSNSILDNSPDTNCYGGYASVGYNIVHDGSCPNINQASDQTSTDPLLGDLEDNGGGIPTYSLLDGSPAMDGGNDATCEDTDARGQARPQDGDLNGSTICDIGAHETTCGDGVMEGPEACDDGNGVNTDACTNTCVVAACGDGVVQTGVEACDEGGDNSDATADACRTDCTNPDCGDGITDTGEGCDDGNGVNTDACTNACALATCGDGILQTGEECDAGGDNDDNDADACRTTCVAADCGDGTVDAGEECDDDDADNADACTNACSNADCGDGFLQSDEACDDGNLVSGDGCSDACVSEETEEEEEVESAVCGNETVEEGEECDDGNTELEDGCSSACSFETFDDLAEVNSDLDFSSLSTGGTIVSLAAPDPTSFLELVQAPLFVSPAGEDCACQWSVTPESFGAFDSTTICSPTMSINGTDQANLAVTVICGETSGSYNQTLIVTGEATGNSATDASASGGCSVRPAASVSPVLILLLVLPLSLAVWKRRVLCFGELPASSYFTVRSR